MPSVLVFYKTAGFYHTSIPAGLAALQKMGKENGFRVDTTKNAGKFVPDTLQKYKAVIFLNTTGDVLNDPQQTAFEQYIKKGGGFVGVHAATDTEYSWPWYNQLVGAYFANHPKVQTATVRVVDKGHAATHFLPEAWVRKDEWYNFKNLNPKVKVLAHLDETTYSGGTNGAHHPIAWYHTFDGGRAFYTGGGHTAESYAEPLFLQHLLGGIQYVLGLKGK
ncbi:hypothetical protein GCM10011405_32620 [Rufibacter glacialis]|nr:hypothetical protein GCM10011405_32620 [Rufibacter glacialis]